MKVILEIDEKYAGVLSVTAVGNDVCNAYVSLAAADLGKCNYMKLDADGSWMTALRIQPGKTDKEELC